MSIINDIVNLVYGTNKAVDRFKKNHPNERVIAASGVKAVRDIPKTEVDTGAQWVVAKRAVAILSDQRIKCGDWDIPLSSIATAELINMNGLISKGQVLNISTNDGIGYQLGMQFNKDWLNCKELPLKYVAKKIKISIFSWIIRIILLAYLGYIVYDRFVK